MNNQCCCNKGGYTTPWCSLLKDANGCGCSDGSVLNLWYKLPTLKTTIRKRLAYLGNDKNYENVPDVNDLVGVGSDPTKPKLSFTYSNSDMRGEIKKRLAYLGRSSNYENVPNTQCLTEDGVFNTRLDWYVPLQDIKDSIRKRLAYLGKSENFVNAPNIQDLLGVDATNATDTTDPLLFYYDKTDIATAVRERLAYIGKSGNLENVPDPRSLYGYQSGQSQSQLQLSVTKANLETAITKRLAYLGKSGNFENAPDIQDLLGAAGSVTETELKFVIPTADIKEEIQKNTAYLGKFRRTEDTPHLLDLIAMTDDEDNLFESFVKSAMTDVWNVLSAPFSGVPEKSAWWQATTSGSNEAGIHYLIKTSITTTSNELEPIQNAILKAVTARVIWQWLTLCYPAESATYDAIYTQSTKTIRDLSNKIQARQAQLLIPLAKEATADIQTIIATTLLGIYTKVEWAQSGLNAYLTFDQTLKHFNAGEEKAITDAIQEALMARIIYKWLSVAYPSEAPVFDAEYTHACDNIRQLCHDFSKRYVVLLEPLLKEATGDVWNVLSAPFVGVTNKKGWYELDGSEVYSVNTVYYEFGVDHNTIPNEKYPLDSAIKEALVSRVIWKWLAISYPAEAPTFESEYNQACEAIRKLSNDLAARWAGLLLPLTKEAMGDVWNVLSPSFAAIDSKAVNYFEESSITVSGHVFSYPKRVQFNFDVNYRNSDAGSSSVFLHLLKNSVQEALVARIIYKWLTKAYPVEAPIYEAEYEKACDAIRKHSLDWQARWAQLYVPFAKEAVNDVWATLSAPFVGVDKIAKYDDSTGITYEFDAHYDLGQNNVEASALNTAIQEALANRIIYKWLILAYPADAPIFDAAYQNSLATIRNLSNTFKARWANSFEPFAQDAMADVYDALAQYMPQRKTAYIWNEGQTTIEVTMPSTLPVENPTPFSAGDWLDIDGQLYVALADGDINDTAGKLLPTEDYRQSIHYVIRWNDKIDPSFVGPVDTAIFEALVARIIYKWLFYSMPDEALRYKADFEDRLKSIKQRCDRFTVHVVNRIPRP